MGLPHARVLAGLLRPTQREGRSGTLGQPLLGQRTTKRTGRWKKQRQRQRRLTRGKRCGARAGAGAVPVQRSTEHGGAAAGGQQKVETSSSGAEGRSERSTAEDCGYTTSTGGHESCLEVPELRPRPPQRRAKAVQNLRGTETRATSGHTKPTCSDGHDEVLGTSTRQSQPAGLQASPGCQWTAVGCKQWATWHGRSHGAEPSGATA